MKLKDFFWDSEKDLLHYVLLYGSLLLVWVPLMNYFNQLVVPTAIIGFFIFLFVDKLLHKFLRV